MTKIDPINEHLKFKIVASLLLAAVGIIILLLVPKGYPTTLVFIKSPSCNTDLCLPAEVQAKEAVNELGMKFRAVTVEEPIDFPVVYILSKDNRMSPLFPVQDLYVLGDFLCDQIGTEKACAMRTLPKKEVPQVQLFIMSLCPYGLQMEKAIMPVLAQLQGQIDFKVRFLNYTLHGDKEMVESMTEFCIRETNESLMVPYLNCYSQKGNAAYCVAYAGLNSTFIEGCFANLEDRTQLRRNALNQTVGAFPVDQVLVNKYKVTVSPTLVVNDKVVMPNTDPNSLLDIDRAVLMIIVT